MSNNISKEELKAPDVFVSTTEKVFSWIEKNFALIGTVIGLSLVVSLGWMGYDYYRATIEVKAAEEIYKSEAELKAAEAKVRDERAKKLEELAAKKGPKAEDVRPDDYAKDFAPAVEKIKLQIKAHAGTKAALISALNLSYFLVQQKQYPEAMGVLDLPQYKPSEKEVLSGFWHMHRGLTYLENQKADDAIKAYETVLAAKPLKGFHPEALLKLGVALEIKGQKDKARDTYERLGREFPNTEASTSAKQFLRLLELNQPQQG